MAVFMLRKLLFVLCGPVICIFFKVSFSKKKIFGGQDFSFIEIALRVFFRITNSISVYNDGEGIPIEVHPEEGMYVPTLIFGTLLTSSNYDDSESKVVGTLFILSIISTFLVLQDFFRPQFYNIGLLQEEEMVLGQNFAIFSAQNLLWKLALRGSRKDLGRFVCINCSPFFFHL